MKTIYDVFKQQVTAQTDAVAVMDEKKMPDLWSAGRNGHGDCQRFPREAAR